MKQNAGRAKPVSEATRALLAEMSTDAAKPKSEDSLKVAKSKLAELRDLEMAKADLEEQVKKKAESIRIIKEQELVSLMDSVGLNSLGIDAFGNLPPYNVKLEEYFHANIPEATQKDAYDWLRSTKNEDLIKTTFTVSFGLREAGQAEKFMTLLRKSKVEYAVKQGVPWNTLTSFVKQEFERGRPLTKKVMGLLGATSGRVVKVIKQKVEKK